MRHDIDVLKLFAEANPRPTPHHPSDLAEILERFAEPVEPSRSENRWIVAEGRRRPGETMRRAAIAAALAIFAVASLIFFNASNLSPVAESPGSGADHVAFANEVISARNQINGARLKNLIGTAEYTDRDRRVEDFEAYAEWLGAMDSRLLSAQCRPDEIGAVACDYLVSDRLVRYEQITPTGTITFEYDSTGLIRVTDTINSDSYGKAFEGFFSWIDRAYPQSAVEVRDDSLDGPSPYFTADAARALDTLLTEYTSDPVEVADRYIAARNSLDAADLADMVTQSSFRSSGRILRAAELPFYFEWLNAMSWRLENADCRLSGPKTAECTYDLINRLTRFEGLTKPGTIVVHIEAGRVNAIDDPFDVKMFSQDFMTPFYDWVGRNHPDSIDTMWLEYAGEAAPRYSPASVHLFEQLLTEYTGTP